MCPLHSLNDFLCNREIDIHMWKKIKEDRQLKDMKCYRESYPHVYKESCGYLFK
jgi:hypothetical protein